MTHIASGHLQWIEYSQLTNLRVAEAEAKVEAETATAAAMPLDHGCTHVADWLQQTNTSKMTAVILKKIADGRKAQSFDFYQVRQVGAMRVPRVSFIISQSLSLLTHHLSRSPKPASENPSKDTNSR